MGLNIRIHNITSPNNFILSYKIGGLANCETVETDGFTIYRKDNINGTYPSSLERNYQTEPIVITDITLNNIFLKTFYVKITDVVTGNYRIDMLKVNGIGFYINCLPENVCDFITDTTIISAPTPTPTMTIMLVPTATPTQTLTSTPTQTLTSTPTRTSLPNITVNCERGPTLYDDDGNPSILNITTTSLTFRFDGQGITEISWRIKNGSTILRSGFIQPTSSIVNITYNPLSIGTYTFEIEGANCLSLVSSSTFDIAQVIVPTLTATPTLTSSGVAIITPTATPTLTSTQLTISSTFTLTSTNQFNIITDAPEYYLDSIGDGSTAKYSTLQTPIGFDYYNLSGTRVTNQTSRFGLLVNWTQKLVAIQGTQNNIVQEGNKTYYFRPPNYQTNTSYNMYDFHLTFPEFAPIPGKIIAIQPVPFDDNEQIEMVKRGVTHVRRASLPINQIYFLSDDWIDGVKDVNGQNLYIPPAYQGLESDRNNFYEFVDPYQMARQFYDTLVLLGKINYGYIFWNYERLFTFDDRIGTWGAVQPRPEDIGKPKKLIFFEEFNRLKPTTTLLAAWSRKPIVINPAWVNQNTQIVWDNVYNGNVTTLQQLDTLFANNNLEPRVFPNGINGFLPLDIYQVGFYQTGIKEYQDYMYKHIFEAYINKKIFPNKKVIGTLWTDNETLASVDTNVQINTYTYYGITKQVETKPSASMTYMQTFAIWMTAIADGFDIWEFREFKEDLSTWNRIDQPQLAFQPPHYPYKSFKGVDWSMSGVYSLKQNQDILLANTEWVFPISPWTAAGGFFNASTKLPLIAYKLNSTGTQALVLAVDMYNEDMLPKIVNVNINGQNQEIKIVYKFTSVVRVQL